MTKEYDIASDDAGVCKNGIESLKKNADMLHDMEGKNLSGILLGRDIKVFRDMSVGYDPDEEAKKALEFIRAKLH